MKDVLSVEDACMYLKLAKPTLYKFARSGTVPAFKIGSVWRFHKESLDQWMRDRMTESTAERKVSKERKDAK